MWTVLWFSFNVLNDANTGGMYVECNNNSNSVWILFANIKRIRLPGTEHMNKEYHQKWFHVQAL